MGAAAPWRAADLLNCLRALPPIGAFWPTPARKLAGGDEEQLLRRAAACGKPDPSASLRIEQLIATGAWESAAIELLPAGTAYMLSCSPDGHHMATVVLAEWPDEVNTEGPSFALALIAALIEAKASVPTSSTALLN